MSLFLIVICGLLLTAVGLSAQWPAWAWAVMATVLMAAPLIAIRAVGRRSGSVPPELEPHLTAAPVERQEQRVVAVALPSAWDDYDFLFSATVRWCPTGACASEPILNPAGLAVDAVLERARTITEHRSPARAALVQHELNGALSRIRPCPAGHLMTMAEGVTLILAEHDRERLERLAAVRKDKAVWEHQRKHEQSKREYLGQDVLKDTGSAVVWWLSRNDDQVDKTVQDIGLLAQLASAANNTEVPEQLRHLVPALDRYPRADAAGSSADSGSGAGDTAPGQTTAADHYDAFLLRMGLMPGDPRRHLVTRQVADVIETQGRHETAEELRRRFDAPEAPDSAQSDGNSEKAEKNGDDEPDGF